SRWSRRPLSAVHAGRALCPLSDSSFTTVMKTAPQDGPATAVRVKLDVNNTRGQRTQHLETRFPRWYPERLLLNQLVKILKALGNEFPGFFICERLIVLRVYNCLRPPTAWEIVRHRVQEPLCDFEI